VTPAQDRACVVRGVAVRGEPARTGARVPLIRLLGLAIRCDLRRGEEGGGRGVLGLEGATEALRADVRDRRRHDVIPLRTEVWGDPVHLYPTRATPEQARQIFVRMLER